MNRLEIKKYINNELASVFSEVEAGSMTRILMEDYVIKLPVDDGDYFNFFGGIRDYVEQIKKGVPIQYVVGTGLFNDMHLKVNPYVLIPRPETEEVMRAAFELIPSGAGKTYMDIGTGTGCIALGLKQKFPEQEIIAVEKSENALLVAQENAKTQELVLDWIHWDILDWQNYEGWSELDGIISNPPYIPHGELAIMGENVVAYEPELALMVPDEDPLIFYRTIGELGMKQLKDGAWLLFEINEYFGNDTKALLEKQGYKNVEIRKDMSGKDRMVLGWK